MTALSAPARALFMCPVNWKALWKASLAWMIDPSNRSVEIYRPNAAAPEVIHDAEAVKGEGPIEGFVLNLAPVWDPLGS